MSIAEKAVEFKELEKYIFSKCCEIGRAALKEALEAYDKELSQRRDFRKYRHKGSRKTVMKTVMGEVEYRRNVYESRNEDGRKVYVYLLDEALGRTGSGFFSALLSEEVIRAVCESTYRSGARTVSELSGQAISHTAAWNVVQQAGQAVDTQEKRAAARAVRNKGAGKLETPLLFEEQDGIWLSLQGKSRKQYGSSREMKLGIAYSGARETGRNRYELTGKVACASFENTASFERRMEGVIAQTYNVDEISVRLLNGDGADWIKSAIRDETVHFQLDAFHRNKAVLTYVRNAEIRKEIFRLLYSKQIDTLLEYLEALTDSVENEDERQRLETLLVYFRNNRDGLIPCHLKELDLPEAPEGRVYRRMGAMESNIFTILGNRMKGGRACWSIKGGNNLARLLCLKFTGKLTEAMDALTSSVLPEKYAEEVRKEMSAANIQERVGKGCEPKRGGAFPSDSGGKWLRDFGKIRPETM